MCFNANVSFGASAVIGTIGIFTLRKVKYRSQCAFAGIPLLFAIQQFVEGILWLALKQPDAQLRQQIATYIFIIIAQVIWPVWVPFSILLLENGKQRKKILLVLLVFGICSSLLATYRLHFYDVIAQIEDRHIKYTFDFSSPILPLFSLFYILPTIISPFVSSTKKMILLGTLLLSSLIISKLFFEIFTTSVWCFFAAVISSMIFVIIKNLNLSELEGSSSSFS